MKPNHLPVLLMLLMFTCAISAEPRKDIDVVDSGDHGNVLKALRTLAEQGDAIAQYNLGIMFRHGKGVAQDYREAFKWFKLAAEQGNSEAQLNIGSMYVLGQSASATRDDLSSYMWIKIAASNGNSNALKSLAQMEKFMSPTQIAEAQLLAEDCIARDFKGC